MPVYEKLKTHEGSPRTKHLLTNLTVNVDPGGSTASAHCYWTVLQSLEPLRHLEIILSGQYKDTFEKVGGTGVSPIDSSKSTSPAARRPR